MPRSSRPPPPKSPKTRTSSTRAAAKGSTPGQPRKKPSVEVRVREGLRPGAEVHEISYDSDRAPNDGDAEAGATTRPDPYPEHEHTKQGIGLGEQVRQTMPTRSPPKPKSKQGITRRDTQDFDKPTNPPPSFGNAPVPSKGEPTDPFADLEQQMTDVDIAKETKRRSPSADIDLGLELGGGPDLGDANDALDLVTRNPVSSILPPEPGSAPDPLAELRERYALGDFSGALAIAEGILSSDARNVDAQRYAESCRDVLRQMYAARLGPLDQVPVVSIPAEQLRWLTLDHRAGFLLSHVDGVSTLEEILDVSGMNPLEAMRIIYDLLQQKVIALQ